MLLSEPFGSSFSCRSCRSLKATAIDSELRVIHAETVNFDASFPQYGTKGGVHQKGLRATAPPAMWIQAFDEMFNKLQVCAANIPITATIRDAFKYLNRSIRFRCFGLG